MDLSPKSKTYLSQIERGEVIPHGITREKIARALGVKREDIWPEDAEQVA